MWWGFAVVVFAAGVGRGAPYAGDAVLRVEIPDRRTLATLVEAGAEAWSERRQSGPIVLRVPATAAPALAASGLPTETLVADLQAQVEEEAARLRDPVAHGEDFFADFRDLRAIDAHLETLAEERPDIVRRVELGRSIEDRPIRGIRIGTGDAEVLVTGTVHGREWIATMTTICIADRLVHGEGVDEEITALLERAQIVVVPVANPDGYAYTWNTERFWRKNRRGNHGVDLNRNFSVGWGGLGSSDRKEAPDYHGATAMSEPEAMAIADFVEAEIKLVAHIDLHAYGEFVLYPWSHEAEEASDADGLASLAGSMAEAMKAAHGESYVESMGFDLYPAAGVLTDWSYGEAGLMALTAELRPAFYAGGFVVEPELIEPTCDETLAGAMEVFTWAAYAADVPETTGATTTMASTGASDGSAGTTGLGEPAGADGGTGSACACTTSTHFGLLWLIVLPAVRRRARMSRRCGRVVPGANLPGAIRKPLM